MLQILGLLAGVIGLVSVIPYIVDILKKKSRPQRASWFIWSTLGGIAFFSQLAKGATDSLWMTAGQTTAVVVIFLLSLKYGEGGLGSSDKKALVVALVGCVMWAITKDAVFALMFVIMADCAGAVLTIAKAYKDPSGETMLTWFLGGLSGLIGTIAVGFWNPVLQIYPIYICLINWAVVMAMFTSNKIRRQRLQVL